MARVVVLDRLSQDGLHLLESAGEIQYEVRLGLKGDQLRVALLEFDAAICRSGVQITREALTGNQRLQLIVRAGAGVDNIDMETATRMGIVVMNTPDGNTISVAEHTIAMMLALSRNVGAAHRALVEGRWDRKLYMGVQLAGKTLGIVGLGRVGRVVASRARAMEMHVLGYDPFLTERKAKELGIETCSSVRQMLPRVDYLSVHTPLTDETRKLIGAEEIQLMKKGARLINCARGGIFDEQSLADGLKSGRLGGVALDVYETEPCTNNPLLSMPNVLGTPHLGASTEEAQSNVAVAAAEQLIDFFRSGAMKQSLNTPLLDPQTGDLCGYMNLAYRLGLLLAQVENKTRSDRCTLRCEGEIAQKDCRLVFAAFAAGLLERTAGPRVNIVNSRTLLHERGIELIEQCSSEIGDFRSLITAEMVGDPQTATAAGTVLGSSIPGLVRIGNCDLECRLEGVLLVTAHSDTPGVIGKIGEVCGRHRVNIAYLSVGRGSGKPTGKQVGVLMLDSKPPPEALDELLALEPIRMAAVVHLPPAEELPFWFGGKDSEDHQCDRVRERREDVGSAVDGT